MKEKNKYIISGPGLGSLRDAKGLTQEDLAEILGIARATVVTWEGKKKLKVSEKHLDLIKSTLKVTLEDLTKDVSRETISEIDLLDHPVIKSLVEQSNYIMSRVKELEDENRRLRGQ